MQIYVYLAYISHLQRYYLIKFNQIYILDFKNLPRLHNIL